tara:strand:- start:5198 stop:5686 length:489 start_codon:yes stop_codon:yes gene_type:complete
MKKIAYLTLLIILSISIKSCSGYKPIFSSSNLNFNIQSYSIEGNRRLGNNIYSKLHNLSKAQKNKENLRNIDLYINVSDSKEGTSKDTAGKILEYKISIRVEIKINDSTNSKKILNEVFTSSTSYKTQSEYSQTLKLEEKSLDNLLNSTYQKVLIKLSNVLS